MVLLRYYLLCLLALPFATRAQSLAEMKATALSPTSVSPLKPKIVHSAHSSSPKTGRSVRGIQPGSIPGGLPIPADVWNDKDKITSLGIEYGNEKEYKQALYCYRRGAELGNLAAMNNLGNLYSSGNGFPKDYNLARQWFDRAAALGHARAMRNIASMYREGTGVTADDCQAMQWYKRAAEAHDVLSMGILGVYYYTDKCPEMKNIDEGARWVVTEIECSKLSVATDEDRKMAELLKKQFGIE